uniref:Uncharacterized protein n=1 Tax=Anguilla anguilla TaxID=7936 RepID=A0A0E9XUR3_ANGAN
MLPIQPDRA